MENKEYWVEVSFTGRIKMLVNAENEQDVKEKVFESITGDFDSNNADINVEEVEWDLLEKEASGNVREQYVSDMYIEEQ